jgi:aminopeptidase
VNSDARWDRLADILVRSSTRTGAGDRVLIAMIEVDTFPLARAVYASALRAGAFPQIQFSSALLERDLMLLGTKELVDRVPDLELAGLEWADVYVGLRGFRNPYELDGIAAEYIVAHRRALGTVSHARNERTRWVLVRVPNEAFAQHAGLPQDEALESFFAATLRDWEAESTRLRSLQAVFETAERVRLTGRDTDLTFSTAGRRYLLGDGTHNMPDGEIYTAPVDDSAAGVIAFEFPGIYGGNEIPGVRLELEAGRVVSATAGEKENLLREILDTDEGAARIGEFGVGTNFDITRFSKEILYDEKIGGTIHLALGRAYRECGGLNHSAVHWDLVKDLRQEGAIYLDEKKVFENGRWLVDW